MVSGESVEEGGGREVVSSVGMGLGVRAFLNLGWFLSKMLTEEAGPKRAVATRTKINITFESMLLTDVLTFASTQFNIALPRLGWPFTSN